MQTNTTIHINFLTNDELHSHYKFYISTFSNVRLFLQKVSVTCLCLFLIFANWNLPWAHKSYNISKAVWSSAFRALSESVFCNCGLRIKHSVHGRVIFHCKIDFICLSYNTLLIFCVRNNFGVLTSLNGKNPRLWTDDDLDQLQKLSLPWLMECERVNYFCKREFDVVVKSILMNFNLKCMYNNSCINFHYHI